MSLPSHDHEAPREPSRRRRGGIVWQPHTEGFATIAYRDGRAIAGISGPWSSQYVLIWWQPTQPIEQVEVFDSLEEAKLAVARDGGGPAATRLSALLSSCRRELASAAKPAWYVRAWRWLQASRRRSQIAERRRRRDAGTQTDLTGLSFPALR